MAERLLVPKELNNAIELLVKRDHTIDARPGEETEAKYKQLKSTASNLIALVTPIHNEWLNASVQTHQTSGDVYSVCTPQGATSKCFVGRRNPDGTYTGKLYLTENGQLLRATYGIFTRNGDQADNFIPNGNIWVDFGKLQVVNGVQSSLQTVTNGIHGAEWINISHLTDGCIKYEWMSNEQPNPKLPAFYEYKDTLLNVVTPAAVEGVHRVYSIRKAPEMLIEKYFVDKYNKRVTTMEEILYNVRGQYFHRVNGEGTCVLEPNTRYEGQIQEGFVLTGKGSILHISPRTRIIGNFQNGQLISPGKIISDEWEYEGAIVNEKPHGQGKMTWLSGDWCTGTFVNGLAEGPNNTFYDNCSESTYTGTMKAGLKDGRGRAVFKKGDVYEGEYCHGLSCGQGTYKYANGDVYTGGFDQGVPHGPGTITKGGVTSQIFYTHGREGDCPSPVKRRSCCIHN